MQAFTLAQTAFNVQLASPVVVFLSHCSKNNRQLDCGFYQLSYSINLSENLELHENIPASYT
jgi:hypothetical protein